MSIINQEMRRLNNIANTYNKTDGPMKEMWRQKWYSRNCFEAEQGPVDEIMKYLYLIIVIVYIMIT